MLLKRDIFTGRFHLTWENVWGWVCVSLVTVCPFPLWTSPGADAASQWKWIWANCGQTLAWFHNVAGCRYSGGRGSSTATWEGNNTIESATRITKTLNKHVLTNVNIVVLLPAELHSHTWCSPLCRLFHRPSVCAGDTASVSPVSSSSGTTGTSLTAQTWSAFPLALGGWTCTGQNSKLPVEAHNNAGVYCQINTNSYFCFRVTCSMLGFSKGGLPREPSTTGWLIWRILFLKSYLKQGEKKKQVDFRKMFTCKAEMGVHTHLLTLNR